MKYLITGITGFLGPHLANKLVAEGHEVYGLVRINMGRENDLRDIISDDVFSKLKFVYSDLCNYRKLLGIFKEEKFDGIFHLAAQTHPPTSFTDPIGTWEWNVMGSVNLMTAMMDTQPECKFLFCSTVEVYGNEGIDGRKLNEDDKFLPANPYGAQTLAAQIPTPVPHENFAVLPVVTSDPYGYGIPDPYERADDAALAAAEGGDPTKMKVGAK